MSAGHDHPGAGQNAQTVDRLLSNNDFRMHMWKLAKIDRTYDLPYLGGTSKDGTTVYLDRHLPEQLKYHCDGNHKEFDPTPFLCAHERFERAAMDCLGWGYSHAHAAATAFERRQVIQAGHSWSDYQKCMEHLAKCDEHEALQKVPPDLDMRPYLTPPVNRLLVARMQVAMGGKHLDKFAKNEVDYSKGMAKSHCGPTEKWPTGDCEHYEGSNSCALVRGYISPEYWCKKYEKKET